MKNVTVEAGATINYSIIDSDTTVSSGCIVGRTRNTGEQITVIGSDLVIPEGTHISGGEMVDAEWLDKNTNCDK